MAVAELSEKIEIVPTGAALGAEVKGVDLARDVDDRTYRKIRQALAEHEVVFIRDQHLTPQAHIAFAQQWGPLKIIPFGDGLSETPELYVISNIRKDGKPIGSADAGRYWHTDGAYLAHPHLASMLYAVEVPVKDGETLGDTLFASMTKALGALPSETRRRVEGLHAIQSLENRYEKKARENNRTPNERVLATRDAHPPVMHPVARPNPISGRKALYVTEGYTAGIVEMPGEDGQALLADLIEHSLKPEFVYRHRWRKGDLVIWDNGATIHRATFDYPPETPRLMYRATVAGTTP